MRKILLVLLFLAGLTALGWKVWSSKAHFPPDASVVSLFSIPREKATLHSPVWNFRSPQELSWEVRGSTPGWRVFRWQGFLGMDRETPNFGVVSGTREIALDISGEEEWGTREGYRLDLGGEKIEMSTAVSLTGPGWRYVRLDSSELPSTLAFEAQGVAFQGIFATGLVEVGGHWSARFPIDSQEWKTYRFDLPHFPAPPNYMRFSMDEARFPKTQIFIRNIRFENPLKIEVNLSTGAATPEVSFRSKDIEKSFLMTEWGEVGSPPTPQEVPLEGLSHEPPLFRKASWEGVVRSALFLPSPSRWRIEMETVPGNSLLFFPVCWNPYQPETEGTVGFEVGWENAGNVENLWTGIIGPGDRVQTVKGKARVSGAGENQPGLLLGAWDKGLNVNLPFMEQRRTTLVFSAFPLSATQPVQPLYLGEPLLLPPPRLIQDSPRIREDEILDWPGFVQHLVKAGNRSVLSPERQAWLQLDWKVRVELARIPARAEIEEATRAILLNALNGLLNEEDYYQPQYFQKVALPRKAAELAEKVSTGGMSLSERVLLNRYLLESGFPEIHPMDQRFAPRDPRRPDVLLISLDTLRADSVSALGYWRDTTPWMRSFFGEKGVLFSGAESPSTWTLPSHAGLFLSQFASRHGVIGANFVLSEESRTLTEVLADQGYRTAAFVDGAFLRHRYGFDQGFQRYDEISGNFASILPRCEQWLANRDRSEPVFLFLHTYDIHDPYNPPEPFYSRFLTQDLIPSRQEVRAADHFLLRWFNQNEVKPTIDDIEFMKAVYDGGILHVDQMLKNFFTKIESRKLLDNPLVVIVSDHGEAFGEHGYFHHGTAIYEELTHVPILMRFPEDRHSGTMVESRVSLIDVAPTLLDYLELPVPEDWQGESLLPFIHDPDRQRSSGIYSENSQEVAHFSAMVKLIQNRRKETRPDGLAKPPIEVYDLEEDPKELENLVHSSPQDFTAEARLMDQALRHMKSKRAREGDNSGSALDPDTIEQLQTLGYLQ